LSAAVDQTGKNSHHSKSLKIAFITTLKVSAQHTLLIQNYKKYTDMSAY